MYTSKVHAHALIAYTLLCTHCLTDPSYGVQQWSVLYTMSLVAPNGFTCVSSVGGRPHTSEHRGRTSVYVPGTQTLK